jgi:hypothetical protein
MPLGGGHDPIDTQMQNPTTQHGYRMERIFSPGLIFPVDDGRNSGKLSGDDTEKECVQMIDQQHCVRLKPTKGFHQGEYGRKVESGTDDPGCYGKTDLDDFMAQIARVAQEKEMDFESLLVDMPKQFQQKLLGPANHQSGYQNGDPLPG